MKNIITLLLICTVPFMSSAQKKSKKSKKTNYEFLVIKGVEINMQSNNREDNAKHTGDEMQEQKINTLINSKSYLTLSFDFGSNPTEGNDNLMKEIRLMKTMADAVNISADYGWKFVDAEVKRGEDYTIHYYYMIKE